MNFNLRRYLAILKNFDWVLFVASMLLICISLVALYSIDTSFENPDFLNTKKQATFALIGLVLFFVVILFDYRFWQHASYFFYFAALILLVAVLFFGRTISGTTGWFSVFGLSFQPVEFAKLALIVVLAWFLGQRVGQIKSFTTFVLSGLLAFIMFVLVVMQPDLGSALILLVIWFGLLFLAGGNKKFLLAILVIAIIASIFSWLFLLQDYQRGRILTFFNPQSDPYGRGYQVHQAVIAVGSGGLFGRGLGFGSQSQLKFIPASQTDFIFAVIAEELGFVGVGLVLFLWGLVLYRLVRAAARVKDGFSTFFILGVSILFFAQLFINIGMNVGLVPVTGIPLPMLSAGGSFLIVSFLALGLTENIITRNKI